jgi:hypothetical protein
MIKHIGIHISYGAGGEGAPAPVGGGAHFKRRKAWWKRQHMAWLVVLAVMLVV